MVISKETPIGGRVSLALRRAKPNQRGPASVGPNSQEQIAMKLKGKKPIQEKKTAAAAVEKQLLPRSSDPVDTQEPSSSSWSPRKTSKTIRINRDNSPITILNAFQKQDMAPEEWDELADQVLTRGMQKSAEETLNAKDSMSEEHVTGATGLLPQGSLTNQWWTSRREQRFDAVKAQTKIRDQR